MQIIKEYFPELTEKQCEQFAQLGDLYADWNSKINVISRKDIEFLYEKHVLHSLALQRIIKLKAGASILDVGTGGGFPGIPLAILFPEVSFTLVDSVQKKIRVVQEISTALGLSNVTALATRAEQLNHRFDFVVSRAVAELPLLLQWTRKLIKQKEQHAMPNGMFAYKGGNIQQETQQLARGEYFEIFPLSDFFKEEYYQEKYIIYVQK